MGGALILYSTNAEIINTKFIKNEQTRSNDKDYGGGAIYSAISSNNTINGGLFQCNTAGKGGAIKSDGILNISGCTVFDGNEAKYDVGAIEISNTATTTTISDATFTGNKAVRDGGAIFYRPTNSAGTPSLTFSGNSVLSGNYAQWTGDAETSMPNDIYSTHDITVASGPSVDKPTTLELNSGYVQAQDTDPQTGATSTPSLTIQDNAQMAAIDMILNDGSVTVEGDTNNDGVGGGALGNGTDIAGLQAALAEAKANGVAPPRARM